MKKIVWSPTLLIPAVGLILFAWGFAVVPDRKDPGLYFLAGLVVTVIGVFLYSRAKYKKQGDIKFVVRRKKETRK